MKGIVMTTKAQPISVFAEDFDTFDAPAPRELDTAIYLLQAPVQYFGLLADHHARPCIKTGNTRMTTFKRWGELTIEYYEAEQVEIQFKDRFTAWVNPINLVAATPENLAAALKAWEIIDARITPRCTVDGRIDRKHRGNLIAQSRRLAQEKAAAAV